MTDQQANVDGQINQTDPPQIQMISSESNPKSQKKVGTLLQEINLDKVKCMKGANTKLVCISEDCSNYGFVCQASEKCQCLSSHKNCVLACLKSILNELASRTKAFSPVKENLIQLINKTIAELQAYRQKLELQMAQKYEQICLTQAQIQFVYAISKGQVKSICGRTIAPIVFKSKFITKINQIIRKTKRQMKNTWDNLQDKIQTFKENFKINLSRCTLVQDDSFFESEIITTFEQTNIIKKFFENKLMRSAKLLYRASENAFKVELFFDKCQYKRNTITLIQTQHGKIIGGYNPMVWIKPTKDEYWIDGQKSSFIFSLTDNKKFVLEDHNTAIRRCSGFGPMWGKGSDLAISNLANENNQSTANIHKSYKNTHYENQTDKSILYQQFTGVKGSGNFRIKEWQVWELQLN